jgi:tetratricopeptide (TPR) repeat protein
MNAMLPYHLASAEGVLLDLREKALIRLAAAIRERGWTQARAAEYLGVSQPRISDVMRGKDQKFSLDTLVQMLAALSFSVTLEVRESTVNGLDMRKLEGFELDANLTHYNEVLELEPEDAQAYGRRGHAHWMAGQLSQALDDFNRAIELDPTRPGHRTNRALILSGLGRHEEALAVLDEVERLFPGTEVDNNRALALRELGRDAEALRCLDRAIALDDSRPGPYWNRARLLESMGRRQEALADCAAVLQRDPTYRLAREKMAELARS